MMRLNMMQAVVDTLDENGESHVANEIALRWSADAGSVKFFRASANFLFKFNLSGQKYVLRFNHATERTPEIIQAEIDYVRHLATQNVLVAKPIQSTGGNDVESVPTELGVFYAVAFEAFSGRQWEMSELSPEMFAEWGEALGQFHNVSQGYPGTGRPTWQGHLAEAMQILPPQECAAQEMGNLIQKQLSELRTDETQSGLIHYDFELDNILWTEMGIGIIDFDDSAHYWFVADIAFALRELFHDQADAVDFGNNSLRRFVRGYRSVRLLEEEELARLPLFFRLHNLISFAKLYQALGSDEPRDAPPWVGSLRNKLLAKMESYRAGFSNRAE